MNSEIEESNRRMTVIIDPHIKANETYPVYEDGLELMNKTTEGNLINIFVQTNNNETYKGWCWPGESVWVDFLNENA